MCSCPGCGNDCTTCGHRQACEKNEVAKAVRRAVTRLSLDDLQKLSNDLSALLMGPMSPKKRKAEERKLLREKRLILFRTLQPPESP